MREIVVEEALFAKHISSLLAVDLFRQPLLTTRIACSYFIEVLIMQQIKQKVLKIMLNDNFLLYLLGNG